jgi:hypothetical protein
MTNNISTNINQLKQSERQIIGFSVRKLIIISPLSRVTVENMASYVISSSMLFVIHDNMINGTNHVV